jgi:translation initiation factor IF-1
MRKDNPKGLVVEALAGTRFRVQMDSGETVTAYLAGKMRIRQVSVFVGDRVEVVLDPAGGKATNRIVWRYLNKQ